MRNRWPILALLCVLASLLVPGIASASAVSSAENRVWAFELPEQVHVTGQHALTPDLHQGCELADYDFASDSLLAAKRGAPDFVVSPGGTAYPVPKGASGPVPVVNPGGKTTGTAFTGGKGGANGQVDTIRLMDPTAPKGASPGYPNGYIKYENAGKQGVNPYTGKTGSKADTHFPID